MTDFARRYRALSNEELLQLCSQRSQLTTEAKVALETEIQNRNLTYEMEHADDGRERSRKVTVQIERHHARWGFDSVDSPVSKRTYRFWAWVAFNTAVAFYLTELIVFLLKRVRNLFIAPPQTLLWATLLHVILTAVCGFVIGFCVWQVLRTDACKWVWLLSAVWFAYGMIQFALSPSESVLANKHLWHHFFGLGTGFQYIKDFSEFTSPLVAGVTYSLGAHASSILGRAKFASHPQAQTGSIAE